MTRVRCQQCGRLVKETQRRTPYLIAYDLQDRPMMLCGRKECWDGYNDGPDVPVKEDAVKVGDVLADGRVVEEVDVDGKPLVVGPRPRQQAAPAPPPEPQPKPAPKKRSPRKAKAVPALNAAAVAEKVKATRQPVKKEKAVSQKKTTQTKQKAQPKKAAPKKTKRATKAKATKPQKTAGRASNKWTDELKASVRKRLEGNETYVSIAAEFGIRPQTLWANLNRAR